MKLKPFFDRNAPTILTCLGGAGVVVTTILAVKATPKAIELIDKAVEEKGEPLTKIEVVKAAGAVYIPSIIFGAATITCIFGANMLNKRQQVAIASAYALLDSSYKEYRKKVIELHGEENEQLVRTSIARDHYENTEESESPLFYDEYSGRYFNASNETVLRAEYEMNKRISTNGGASLNEYYELVGLPKTDYGEYLGWSSDQMAEMYWDNWIYFNHTKVLLDDGLECWIISYTDPFSGYLEY